MRTLNFWRALTAECISTFLYVLLISCISKTISSTPDLPQASTQVYCGLVAGLAIISLTTIFLPVSGAHINPAISLATCLIQRISPIRAVGHVVAQCGGAIAGASVVLGLYGASEHFPTITVTNFGLEFLLSFMIVLVYLRVTDHSVQHDSAISIGISYMAALTAYKGAMNPAFALGQAFVANKFDNHWIFWIGPILGGSCAALCHEYIFNEQKDVQLSLTNPGSDSEGSDIEDVEKQNPVKKKPTSSAEVYELQRQSPYVSRKSELMRGENNPVYNAHMPDQHQDYGQQKQSAPRKKRTHGRSHSFHDMPEERVEVLPSEQIHNDAYSGRIHHRPSERIHHTTERVRQLSGERLHQPQGERLHQPQGEINPHTFVERHPTQYVQVINLANSQSRKDLLTCEPFPGDPGSEGIERHSGDSSGYCSGSVKKRTDANHRTTQSHRKASHQYPHGLKHNHSLDNPSIRLTKAGTLPRELCNPAIRRKPIHMSSLHNLCENMRDPHHPIDY